MELARPAVDIGYVVGDLDAMTAFYAEGLGLEQVTELTLPDDFPGGGRTVRCFAAGDTILKLWSLHAGPPPRGADDRLGQIGMRYTTLHVIDLAGIVAQLESFGYPIAVPPRRSSLGPAQTVAFVRDPDGNHIELVEVDS
jgi:catechol 2,3-dioxygenase-like lactoylglutathione lyase family enzyme